MTPWTILGAGAIGSLIACQLQQAGIPVVLSTRSQPTTQHKITLEHQGHKAQFQFAELGQDQPIEQLILTTKGYQSEAAIAPLATRIRPQTILVVLQNGLGTGDWLQQRFPQATVLGATTTHGAYRLAPNHVVHAGIGETWIGPLRSADRPIARQVYASWQQQGVPIHWDENITKRLWLKLAINCAINPLTVIYDCRNGELLANADAMLTMKAIVNEFHQVYEQRFQEPLPMDLLKEVQQVAEKTAANISSMRQDILNHRPTEIGAINEFLVTQAEHYGISCPENQRVSQLVRQREQQQD